MELNMITVVLGMVVCFTLPLLIIACVLVFVLWKRPKTFDAYVESDMQKSKMMIDSIEVSKISMVINILYIALGLQNKQQTASLTSTILKKDQVGLHKINSVVNRLTMFRGLHNIEDLGRLKRHLTGVVIVLNPVLNSNKSTHMLEK